MTAILNASRGEGNKFIAKLFMIAKYNEEVICGWAN